MKNFCRVLSLIVLSTLPSYALSRVSGWCEQGNQAVVTPGSQNSTTKVQRSYPACQVQVYLTGTLTNATIFSNNLNPPTALGNPFTATANTGQWAFYAPSGTYDIQLSAGGLSTPYVISAVTVIDSSSNYNSFANIVAGTPAGATATILPGTYTVSSPVAINGITVQCQPGVVIQPATNGVMATLGTNTTIDGCTFDAHQSGNNTGNPCITIPAPATHIVFRNSTVRNCGSFAIYLLGSTGTNSHVKVLNSTFNGSFLDAVASVGALDDLELGSNYGDCSLGAANASHCFVVHACYGSGNLTCGTVKNVNFHDNVELCPLGNFCNEIGSFYNAAPQPASSFPTKITLSHNFCLNSPITVPVPPLTVGGSAGCDSLASATDFDIDGDKFDSNNNLTANAPFEFIAARGSARGLNILNCNNAQTLAVSINTTSDFALSDSSLCGTVSLGTSSPAFFGTDTNNVRIHHNRIMIMPGGNPSGVFYGCVVAQLGTAMSNGGEWHIDHNDCTGISTSDQGALVFLVNGICATPPTQVEISNNTANRIEWGFNNQTNACPVTKISYVGNLFGPGVTEFGPAGPQPYHDNPPFQASSPGGPVPTCAYGPGSGNTGACTVFGAGQQNANATPWDLIVYAAITGTPAGVGSTVFTLTVPTGTFGAISPVCLANPMWTGMTPTPLTLPLMYDIASTATSIIFRDAITATAGFTYAWTIHCAPYLP